MSKSFNMATDVDADLIIMETYRYSGLEKIIFGRVADKVIRSATCPVMTIRPCICC